MVKDVMKTVLRSALQLEAKDDFGLHVDEVVESKICDALQAARDATFHAAPGRKFSFEDLDRSEFLAILVAADDDLKDFKLDQHYQNLRIFLRSRFVLSSSDQKIIQRYLKLVDHDNDGLPSFIWRPMEKADPSILTYYSVDYFGWADLQREEPQLVHDYTWRKWKMGRHQETFDTTLIDRHLGLMLKGCSWILFRKAISLNLNPDSSKQGSR